MGAEQRAEQSISWSKLRIVGKTTSAVTSRGKMAFSNGAERKQRMDTSSLMERVLNKDNLNEAYKQVVRNKGAEGVDGMKYTELGDYLKEHGEAIREQLRTRTYKPQPVKRVEIPKPDLYLRAVPHCPRHMD